ncbi:hypothetical protein ALT1644_30016 [Alteromonas macleodii]
MFIRILCSSIIAFILAGCVTTPQEYKLKFAEVNEEYRQLANDLPHLRSASLSINVRKIEYKPLFIVTKSFGDVSFSDSSEDGYLDLLNPDFSRLSAPKGCQASQGSEEDAVNCFKGFSDYHEETSPFMTELSISSAEDGLKDIYKNLKGLDSLVSAIPQEQYQYLDDALSQVFDERYTLDSFSDAVEQFVARYNTEQFEDLVNVVSETKQAEALVLAEKLEKQKLLEEQRTAEEQAERFRRKSLIADHNAANKRAWSERKNFEYNLGDKICSYDNVMGFVEKVANDNVKIQTVGKAQHDLGFFFGNNSNPGASFNFTPMSMILWKTKSEVAPCSFSI